MLVAFSNGFFFPSGGGPPRTNAMMERKVMTAERSRTHLGNPLFWMRKVMANGNAKPANLWLVTTHACQSYLEGANFMPTCRGPSRCYAHSEVFIPWKPLIVSARIVTWQNRHGTCLNGDIIAMHKEAGHPNASHQALSQEH